MCFQLCTESHEAKSGHVTQGAIDDEQSVQGLERELQGV